MRDWARELLLPWNGDSVRVGVLCHWPAGLELPRARGSSSEAQLIINSLHLDVLHTEPSPPWDDHS